MHCIKLETFISVIAQFICSCFVVFQCNYDRHGKITPQYIDCSWNTDLDVLTSVLSSSLMDRRRHEDKINKWFSNKNCDGIACNDGQTSHFQNKVCTFKWSLTTQNCFDSNHKAEQANECSMFLGIIFRHPNRYFRMSFISRICNNSKFKIWSHFRV